MTDVLVIAVLVAWGVTLGFLIWSQESQWGRYDKMLDRHEKSAQKLLDRIMAGDYFRLKQGETYEEVAKLQAQAQVDIAQQPDEASYVGQ